MYLRSKDSKEAMQMKTLDQSTPVWTGLILESCFWKKDVYYRKRTRDIKRGAGKEKISCP